MTGKIKTLFEKFELYGLQAKTWKFYGVITPAFFILVFISFHLMTENNMNIMIAGWVLFILSCLVWWFWTIRILQSLMSGNIELYNMIKSLAEDIYEVKTDVKDISKIKKKNTRQSK